MKIAPINLKGVEFNNILLAPIAGYTDYAFRHNILPLGVGFSFTELTSAKGLYFGGKNSESLLYCGEDYDKTGAQIFGSETYFMRWACESKWLEPFKVVDINMGCPVPKVYKNGEGSALLKDLLRAENIISECAKSGKIITIKTRTGLVHGDKIAVEFAKMAENAGASMITIHGRVREDYYSGEPDFEQIYNAKKAVKIPVIANGGIFTVKDAEDMIDRTGADGVMIARGALSNPFIFSELLDKDNSLTKKQFIFSHLDTLVSRVGEKRAAIEFRKFIPYYLKSTYGVKNTKVNLMNSTSVMEIKEEIDKII